MLTFDEILKLILVTGLGGYFWWKVRDYGIRMRSLEHLGAVLSDYQKRTEKDHDDQIRLAESVRRLKENVDHAHEKIREIKKDLK